MSDEIRSYDDVEISDSDLEQPQDNATPKQPTEDGQSVEAESQVESDESGKTEDAPATVKVGEQEYTIDMINAALDDHKNKSDWQKKNTQEAQSIAERRKGIEPFLQFMEKVKGKPEFADMLKDAITDDFGEDGKTLFEKVMNTDPGVNPYKDEMAHLQKELDNLKSESALRQAENDLKNRFKLKDSDVEAVLDFAVKTLHDTGRTISLEEAYKVMNFDKVQEEATKKKPKPPTLANKDRGAVEIATPKKKDGKPMSYDDIDIGGFDFFNT